MPELPLDAITLHYETAGEGPPLLLVPGMLSDNASWLPLWRIWRATSRL